MLDLNHLSRQTLGDQALEREVLVLFVEQIEALVERVRSCSDRRERGEAAHMIVGSACAVGAFDVARIASRIEVAKGTVDRDIAKLVDIVERTRAFIIARLGEQRM